MWAGGETPEARSQSLAFLQNTKALDNIGGFWLGGKMKNQSYEEFVEKFKPKKTTDDCYTPQNVYDSIADYVSVKYGINKKQFCRPFYPGGDYENYNYNNKIVVDNPPFSILKKIANFYVERKIPFFLFAPTLTSLISASEICTAIAVGANIVYENGAIVSTSFITNLEPEEIRMKTDPQLFEIIKCKNKENNNKKSFRKRSFPPNIMTSAQMYRYNSAGMEFIIPRKESVKISKVDNGVGVYGGGLLMSDRLTADRLTADRLTADRLTADRCDKERIELSEREKNIIKKFKCLKRVAFDCRTLFCCYVHNIQNKKAYS